MKLSFNNNQRKVLIDICLLVGQLAAASMILPFIVPAFDQTAFFVIILGLLMTLGSWSLGVMIARRTQ